MEESVASNSPSATAKTSGFNPSQQIANRITRAFSQRLSLLHRSGANFYILGATGNVYNVTVSTTTSCTCPDRASVPCKHILFVFLCVLGLSLDDNPCFLCRRSLRLCYVTRILEIPSSSAVQAGTRARERFYQVFFNSGNLNHPKPRENDQSVTCPICLEEMAGDEEGVICSTCGNKLHGDCFAKWKRSCGRRAASCVVCRARWRCIRRDQERYINLAAYVRAEEEEEDHASDTVAESSCNR